MDTELIIRVYNVGLGDCIYLQVPDRERSRHILIDCGGSSDEHLLAALYDLEEHYLPKNADGAPILDLLVVTHDHEDHLRAFGIKEGADWFEKLELKNLWLSVGMDQNRPQAQKMFQLENFSKKTLSALQKISLGPVYDQVLAENIEAVSDRNTDRKIKALTLLRDTLPAKLPAKKPVYLHDALEDKSILKIFNDPNTRFDILAPAFDIDGIYLGKIGEKLASFEALQNKINVIGGGNPEKPINLADNFQNPKNLPNNISLVEFQLLRERMMAQAMAFIILANGGLSNGPLANNTSVVLLLQWQGKRLLFVGDAQCKTGRKNIFIQGGTNGSWNAMWARNKDKLKEPLDLIKVGHHGSHNATPFNPKDKQDPVNEILNSLIPPQGSACKVVISTERGRFKTIPNKELMIELGMRASNARADYDEYTKYSNSFEKFKSYLVPPKMPQPLRTDLEGTDVIEIRIPA